MATEDDREKARNAAEAAGRAVEAAAPGRWELQAEALAHALAYLALHNGVPRDLLTHNVCAAFDEQQRHLAVRKPVEAITGREADAILRHVRNVPEHVLRRFRSS